MSSRTADLIAFVAVLGTSVAFIAMDVSPDQTVVLASAATMLYGAWRGIGKVTSNPRSVAAPEEPGTEEDRAPRSTRHSSHPIG